MSDEIAKRLQKARIDAGFKTASDAARRFGWNENTYRSHENGERGLKRDIIFKYARAFNVSPVFIMMDTSLAALDYSGTWRSIAGKVDSEGSTNLRELNPTPANADQVAIFDFSTETRLIALEFVGPRDYGIFSQGDLLLFSYVDHGMENWSRYCLIEYEPKKFVVRLLKAGPEVGTVDIALRPIDPPVIVQPLWLSSLYLLVPRDRWTRENAKKFVNRAADPRTA